MKKKMVIVGGGISGLIASWVYTQVPGLDVVVLEPGKPGGDFAAGGLKYIHKTNDMEDLLKDLRVTYTDYSVQGGILLHGAVEPFPGILKGMNKDRALRIQHDHYRKTRQIEPDAFASRSMNDPESSGPRKALRCDMDLMLKGLIDLAPVAKDGCAHIEPNKVIGTSGARYSFDYLLLTIPIWVIKTMVWFSLPDTMAIKLNLLMVDPPEKVDSFAQWDYVYTPYTPENMIHRISPRDGGYTCEFNGSWEDGDGSGDRLTSELNFLFPGGWALGRSLKGLNGHLLPMTTKPVWPDNIRPIGRFAQWDPRMTSDVVLSTCLEQAKAWNLTT
jgi:hypothetical protein